MIHCRLFMFLTNTLFATTIAWAGTTAERNEIFNLSLDRVVVSQEVTLSDSLTLLENLTREALGRSERSSAEVTAPRIFYEGWRERFRTTRVGGTSPGIVQATIVPNPRLQRFDWNVSGENLGQALDRLCDLRGTINYSIHESTGIIGVREEVLHDNPAWPLNWPLGDHENVELTLEQATTILIDEYHMHILGSPNIWGTPDMSMVVWPPDEPVEGATVRDLIYTIHATIGGNSGLYGAFVHERGFDEAHPIESLEGRSAIRWAYGLER